MLIARKNYVDHTTPQRHKSQKVGDKAPKSLNYSSYPMWPTKPFSFSLIFNLFFISLHLLSLSKPKDQTSIASQAHKLKLEDI